MNDTHVPLMFIGEKIGALVNCTQCFESLSFLFLFYFIFQYFSHIYVRWIKWQIIQNQHQQMHVIRILIELMAKQMDLDSMIP